MLKNCMVFLLVSVCGVQAAAKKQSLDQATIREWVEQVQQSPLSKELVEEQKCVQEAMRLMPRSVRSPQTSQSFGVYLNTDPLYNAAFPPLSKAAQVKKNSKKV